MALAMIASSDASNFVDARLISQGRVRRAAAIHHCCMHACIVTIDFDFFFARDRIFHSGSKGQIDQGLYTMQPSFHASL